MLVQSMPSIDFAVKHPRGGERMKRRLRQYDAWERFEIRLRAAWY